MVIIYFQKIRSPERKVILKLQIIETLTTENFQSIKWKG